MFLKEFLDRKTNSVLAGTFSRVDLYLKSLHVVFSILLLQTSWFASCEFKTKFGRKDCLDVYVSRCGSAHSVNETFTLLRVLSSL